MTHDVDTQLDMHGVEKDMIVINRESDKQWD